MSERAISLSALESHLWESVNILRSPVDAADFKTYIFPLLFFKRISDVYYEEYIQALKDFGGNADYVTFAENHRFPIRPSYFWDNVQNCTTGIGLALQSTFQKIVQANPDALDGIFGANKEQLPDILLRESH